MRAILCLAIICLSFLDAKASTYGQNIIAAVLMAEAWGEGEKGMMAVAEVILKRSKLDRVSPLAVVKEPGEFSCLNRRTPEELYRKFCDKAEFKMALRIARLVYNEPETFPGYTNGADHFTRVDEKPKWAQGRKPVAVIGRHAFYRLGYSRS